MKKRILVAESKQNIRQKNTSNLQSVDYVVDRCDDGESALRKALYEDYDVIVLNVILPFLDGLSVCQQLRDQNIITPIIILLESNSEVDYVSVLEMGADDCLTKPFREVDLHAKAKALIRRTEMLAGQENTDWSKGIQFNNLSIFPQTRSVEAYGKSINLTSIEFDLLIYLANFPGEVISREKLLNAVWGRSNKGIKHTVNSHINRLRAKLEKDPTNPEFIQTVWGIGYKFKR